MNFTFHLDAILSHLIVAFVSLLAGYFLKKYRDYRNNKKYEKDFPLETHYVSTYDDEINGDQLIAKGDVYLHRNGKTFDATDKNLENRVWKLKGDQSDLNFIYGSYHGEHLDKSHGVFFLEILMNRDMEGIWAGYDSVNKTIKSGRYMWRIQHDCSYETVKDQDHMALAALANKRLGKGYVKSSDIENKDNIAFCAKSDNKLVGFCIARIINMQSNDVILHEFGNILREKIHLGESNIGYIASMATDEKYEGRGIGSTLFQKCLKELDKQGIKLYVLVAWKSTTGIHVDSLVTSNGFDKVKEIRNYWREDSLEKGYECPMCGKPPCECSAVLYIRY